MDVAVGTVRAKGSWQSEGDCLTREEKIRRKGKEN